ncbi:MAG: F0F1 ATP synthase subunit delta [Methylovulum sp.]|nr:F0F1 ATP synthase subunit delta [Methylovulum sp.]
MQFDPSTFILEIINFLILIWILQRLFYKPVLEVIAKRKQFIDQTLADAKAIQQQAEQQRRLYENRQKLWEQEKQAAINALHRQLDAERAAHLKQLSSDFEQERQKSNVTLTRKQQELQRQAEKQALQNAAKFAGLLLQQAAGPELEARLFAMLLEQLTTLPEACRLCLQTLDSKKNIPIKVTSAYPLTDGQQQQLKQRLGAQINSPITCQYHQDSQLIAGLRIDIGAWVLNANLQHELAGFATLSHESE